MKLKLKYKKLIIIVSMVVFAISMLSLSLIGKPEGKKPDSEGEILSKEVEPETQVASFIKGDKKIREEETIEEKELEPELVFEVNSDKEVKDLLTKYMNAKLDPKIEDLEPLVNDTSHLDIEGIGRSTNFIEMFDNINTYSLDSPKEGTSLVYSYHEIKFIGIDTLVPGISKFLVVKEEDKDPYIYFGDIEEEVSDFITEFEKTETFTKLIDDVNDKLEKALDEDSVLSEFYAKLYQENQPTDKGQDTSASANE